jgi:DNA-binding SARP family transcriptional activator/DNA-binding beta-propeller fold protein YncE
MEFRLLGPLEVEGEHGVVPLGSAKQRALLAILLLHANERVSRERLVDELWGDKPPASAAHSLEVYVSRLRKALLQAGTDGLLATQGTGYALQLDGQSSDLARFEGLLAESRGAEPERRAALLREALSLWRGPALADVELPGSARASAERLDELRLAALEERIEADLALGHERELVAELQTLLAADPLRERMRSQHMRALYGAGRQADALDSYRDAQRALAELGLEPSPELRAVQRQILNHDPALQPVGAHIDPAPRRRRRRVWALALAVVVLVGVAAGVLVLTGERGSGGASAVSAVDNSVGLFDPAHRRLVADSPTGTLSNALHGRSGPKIAVGLGYVWACNESDRTVLRIDPVTQQVTRTIGLGSAPGAVAVGHGFVWVEPESGTTLLKLDSFGNVVQRIPLKGPPKPFQLRSGPVSVASGPDAIWAVHGLASVAKIDPSSGRVLRDTSGFAGALPGEIVATRTGVWTPAVAEGRLLRLDPMTAGLVAETDQTGGATATWVAVAVGAGGVWIGDNQGGNGGVTNKVWRVDPTTNQVDGSVAVDSFPLGIVVRDGKLWVVCALSGTIDEIDPATFSVISRTRLGGHPLGIANGPDGLWIAFGDLIP